MSNDKQILNNYIRNRVWYKFVNLVKKDICEQCGGTENLQVHHIYPFVNMVEDTLVELGLERKSTDEYTELELKNIEEKVLGKHLFYEYQTLCVNCHMHKGIHKKKKEIVNFSIDENLLNKWLTKNIIVENIIIKNNIRDKNGRFISTPTLAKILKEYGYKLENKRRTKKKITQYMITKLT